MQERAWYGTLFSGYGEQSVYSATTLDPATGHEPIAWQSADLPALHWQIPVR
ncbi:hypothetical protein FE257_007829 [Aspergillus nanangensis]|uniref:Uncharacterized protein n=1 Tax=Aspergillus nanangensis TaxID=2582783 RepID=A0AAD4GYV7_ASPNN|nr:hypothetical protein FE257_007829 [Aspergillus nanangensis]